MKPHIIIGLVGQPLSGKDAIASRLVEVYKFVHISTGDFVRFYIAENNIGEPTRDLEQKIANLLRKKHGPDYFVRLALKTQANRLVISGIRAIAEAASIKAAGGIIIASSAPLEVRYERALMRGRSDDHISLELFKQQEAAEADNPSPNAQNVNAVIDMADYKFKNNDGLNSLYFRIDSLIDDLVNRNN